MALALPWEFAEGLAVASAATGFALRGAATSRVRAAGAFLREAGLILALYGLWQWLGGFTVMGTEGALTRAEWIDHLENAAPIPSVADMQHLVLWSPVITQAANIYYAVLHFPATIGLLVWLFVWHRNHYGLVRWTLASTTLVCLAIQLVPVAPPRMMPDVVDTAALYGQSVYSGAFGAGQLAAMPSVHVAWAVAVGWYVWRIAAPRWRWIGPTHATLTVLVVSVTGNHWWLDGLVAAAVWVACAGLVASAARLVRRRVQGASARVRPLKIVPPGPISPEQVRSALSQGAAHVPDTLHSPPC